ncbi:MAG TPA: hypothetical protein VHV56_13525 [Pseudolabrys sp.]|nr:hypothetical protein [Pseudolabrys sp.]
MARRFILAFVAFVGTIVPAAFGLALLAQPARPATLVQPGCERTLADVMAGVAAMQARMKRLGEARGPEACNMTRLYFLEVVKARAVTALCKNGPERERDLGQLDADVEHLNEAIAARCI